MKKAMLQFAVVGLAAAALTGCSKSEPTPAAEATETASAEAAPVAEATSEAATETPENHGSTGGGVRSVDGG